MTRGLLLALAVALSGAALAAEPETLDGTFWKVRDNSFKQKIFFWRYDHISFKEGVFRSVQFEGLGFAAAPYTATKAAAASIAWTATLNSETKGKVVWEGRRVGNRMEGTWTWRKPEDGARSMPWSARQSLKDYIKGGK